MFLSSTQLFAQTGDTSITYNKEELQKIAAGLVEKNECKELLSLSELDVAKADSVIMAKDSIITQGVIVIRNQDIIIKGQQGDIDRLIEELNKRDNQKKWLKVGWATTAIVEGAIILYLILKP